MRCVSVQSDLPEFLSGSLSTSRSTAVADHLEVCDNCRSIAEELRPAINRLVHAGLPERPRMTDPSFIVNVNRRIDAGPASWRPGPVFLRLGIPAIAGSFILLFAILLLPGLFPPGDLDFSKTELSEIIATMDTVQIQSLREEFATMAQVPGISSIAVISDENPNTPDEGQLTEALFAAMTYSDIVQASSPYLADEDLFDLVPMEVLPAIDTAVDAQ